MRGRHPYWRHSHPLDWLLCGRHYRTSKRVLDIALCLLALPLILPVAVIISALICLDSPGGPFYVQVRTGRNGRRFQMYKFRTMVRNADQLKPDLEPFNDLSWPDFKVKSDPRITRVGRLLRKTSLDELPQLFNVLKGEMSLVGPRPTSFSAGDYQLWHTQRLDAAPGITGLWQVEGRGSMLFDARTRLEIEYVQHQCLLEDAKLLVRTIGTVAGRRGAY